MNRVEVENIMRPVLYNLGVVGKRGPVPSWVLPATIACTCLLVLILIILVKIYESIISGKCIMCGQKHDTSGDRSVK
ncbi:hypothetical protein NY2A_B437L [Paramecium bursaria Chlorella virus NY2A]|uniref:Uncharacterized protein B437L n=1 Tax=Paramecium bursaria Chlorella virus NY2A TaxID=46021 RepID=A7IWW2_PBCVN|nr:hypothetical protein NY2A_B437L [Paramecium bursaria Chlorella virus NY2A]YP_001498465.1 hypothetical protein AR158_C384L [Paramecium bursaria Chlorella virus AR158]ABT14836.1 hypothetical protein NY2A_B437L [Paramecium bursaria Chlorella virus NY2A]ABU43929.1 hypothetical protein AR158_C384L [Paramecium bursaria Chlorella virus AR158]